MHLQMGDSTAGETSGITGSPKQGVMASATPVLTEGASVWPGRTGGDMGSPGSKPRAARTQRRPGSLTGLHAVLCSLNFKSNKVKTATNQKQK